MALTWIKESGPDEKYATPKNEHDTGYKFRLSGKAIFLQLLQSFVRQGWVEQVDEENIMRLEVNPLSCKTSSAKKQT